MMPHAPPRRPPAQNQPFPSSAAPPGLTVVQALIVAAGWSGDAARVGGAATAADRPKKAK